MITYTHNGRTVRTIRQQTLLTFENNKPPVEEMYIFVEVLGGAMFEHEYILLTEFNELYKPTTQ